MNEQEINKRIHEWLGKCWHESPEWDGSLASDEFYRTYTCSNCGKLFDDADFGEQANPDYCNSLDLVIPAVRKLPKEKTYEYRVQLHLEVRCGSEFEAVNAPALQRAKALVEVIDD